MGSIIFSVVTLRSRNANYYRTQKRVQNTVNSGSHHIMVKEGYPPVPIPVHNKDLKKGTEQKILNDLGLK